MSASTPPRAKYAKDRSSLHDAVPVQNYITAILIFLVVEMLMTWGFYGMFARQQSVYRWRGVDRTQTTSTGMDPTSVPRCSW